MLEHRCANCNKLLATLENDITTIPNDMLDGIESTESITNDSAKLHIKCPRCKETATIIV